MGRTSVAEVTFKLSTKEGTMFGSKRRAMVAPEFERTRQTVLELKARQEM